MPSALPGTQDVLEEQWKIELGADLRPANNQTSGADLDVLQVGRIRGLEFLRDMEGERQLKAAAKQNNDSSASPVVTRCCGPRMRKRDR